jgi:hypothetical protein
MNRHTPKIVRTEVSAAPVRVYQPGNSAQSIPAVVENHGLAAARLIFTQTGVDPDPDSYVSLPAGKAIECNPGIDIWVYTPSGAIIEIAVVTGIRHVGTVDGEADSTAVAIADQVAMIRQQKQLLADIDLKLGVLLRYAADIADEEFGARDALKI